VPKVISLFIQQGSGVRGVMQNFLSRFFFFSPSRIGAGGREGEGVGDGEWNMDGEGIGAELCRGERSAQRH